MPEIKVKNLSSSTLLNRQPGAEFTLKVDADGIPLGNLDHRGRNADIFWRQRLDEDKKFNGDTPALQITAVPPPTPAPVASPVAASKKAAANSAAPATPDKE